MPRQIDRKDAPGARHITNCQITLHCFETAPANIKPQSKSRAISAGLNERQHQFFGCSFRKTATVILDLNRDTIFGHRAAKPDLRVAKGEFERVMQQITNRGRQHLRVCDYLNVLDDGCNAES